MLSAINKELCPFALEVASSSYDNDHTIYLISPQKNFWQIFSKSPEYADGDDDPMDRFSKRILDQIADTHGGKAIFPSDGPPYPPFIRWALASQQVYLSPVNLLVHVNYGLMVSFRGALKFEGRYAQCLSQPSPCELCSAPCLDACSVGALTKDDYNVPLCKTTILTEASQDRAEFGCTVRRACPLSQSFSRDPEQSAFHMRAFTGRLHPRP